MIIVAIMIPTLTSIAITFIYTKQSLENKEIEDNMQLLYQIGLNIEQYMDRINKASLSVYYDPVRTSIYQTIRYGGADLSSSSEIHSSMQALLHFDENIYQVHLYTQEENKEYYYNQKMYLVMKI